MTVSTGKVATEAACRKAIIQAAMYAGWRVHCPRTARTGAGGHLTADEGHQGWPDLAMVRGHQLVCIELKRDKTGRMRPGQPEWKDALNAVPGVTALVVWVPSGQDALIKALTSRSG